MTHGASLGETSHDNGEYIGKTPRYQPRPGEMRRRGMSPGFQLDSTLDDTPSDLSLPSNRRNWRDDK